MSALLCYRETIIGKIQKKPPPFGNFSFIFQAEVFVPGEFDKHSGFLSCVFMALL